MAAEFDILLTVNQWVPFLTDFFNSALQGNLLAIVVLVIGAIVLLVVLFGVTAALISLVRRIFLSVFILVSMAFFIMELLKRIDPVNPDPILLGIGFVVVVIGLIAFVISLFAVKTNAKSYRETRKEGIEGTINASETSQKAIEEYSQEVQVQPVTVQKRQDFTPTQIQSPRMFTTQALKEQIQNDKSLLAVLSYVIIAEFGIFSSKTLPAPSIEVGIIFFGIFFVGAFVFIRTSYYNYLKAIGHLMVALLFGFVLSILLGHFWGGTSLNVLFSLEYFRTDSLVALVTGMAVSLLMGSKN